MASLHRLDVAAHFGYLTETRWGMDLDADPAAERVRQWRDYTVWASDDDEPPPTLMQRVGRAAGLAATAAATSCRSGGATPSSAM